MEAWIDLLQRKNNLVGSLDVKGVDFAEVFKDAIGDA